MIDEYNSSDEFYDVDYYDIILISRKYKYSMLKEICIMLNNNVNLNIIYKKFDIGKIELQYLYQFNLILNGRLKSVIKNLKKDYIKMDKH